jgi:hypothetical protein
MAVLKDKGLKATKKPVDLLALSLGKLKAKLKDRLNAEKVMNHAIPLQLYIIMYPFRL